MRGLSASGLHWLRPDDEKPRLNLYSCGGISCWFSLIVTPPPKKYIGNFYLFVFLFVQLISLKGLPFKEKVPKGKKSLTFYDQTTI